MSNEYLDSRQKMPIVSRRKVVGAFGAALTAASLKPAHAAAAKGFGATPLRIVTAYSAGSGPDVFGRYVAEKLAPVIDGQVIVDGKPGANGVLAIDAVRRGSPDGHDLVLLANSHLTINPTLIAQTPYNVERDLAPVALLYQTPFFIAVAADSPWKDVASLIAAAKAKPGDMKYGSPYVGSPSHLGSLMLESLAGIRMVHVPFKDVTQIYISVANHDLDWAYTTIGSAKGLLSTGRVRLLAIAAAKRLPSQPDIPTVAEAGGPPDLRCDAWVALMGPKSMPAQNVLLINSAVKEILTTPASSAFAATLGFEVATATPSELTALIKRDTDANAQIISRFKLTAE